MLTTTSTTWMDTLATQLGRVAHKFDLVTNALGVANCLGEERKKEIEYHSERPEQSCQGLGHGDIFGKRIFRSKNHPTEISAKKFVI